MKYYIISGEASGDLHGSNLMQAIESIDSEASFRFWGGDLMKAVSGKLVRHYKELAFMGFTEVLLNIRTILNNLKFCKSDILDYNPDKLILIDYPGFNMRIAEFAKKNNIEVHYYISPQLWAWKENRIQKIKRDVDFMYVILPFEKEFYEKKHQFPVSFVGHPLIDAISKMSQVNEVKFREKYQLSDKPIIALLPGSRKQEIKKMLGLMLSQVDQFKDYQFVIAGAPSQDYAFYRQFLNKESVKFVPNKTYELLSLSYAALVTSGTATLETALFKVPEIVCYKTSWVSFQIGKRLVRLEFISLVNLIMGRKVVTELIQSDFTESNLTKELTKILDSKVRSTMFLDYFDLEKKLGGKGASLKTAKQIVKNKRAD